MVYNNHMKNTILKRAAINALATALYIIVIASFLFYAPKFFGPDGKTVLIPIVMLLLLVFSAALVGTLIFGQPILWYLEGKKKESLSLLVYTFGVFLGITVVALLALYFAK